MDNLAQSVDGGHSRKRLHLAAHRLEPGCPPPPYNGGTPRTPAVPRHGHSTEFLQKPENRQELGVGHGQPQAVAHPATVAPVPGTPPAG